MPEVKLVAFKAEPSIYPAPLVIALLLREISAEPSKATPAIFLAVVSVAADPVVFWFKVSTENVVPVSIKPDPAEYVVPPLGKFVKADPSIAGKAPVSCPAGIDVRFVAEAAGSVAGNLSSGTVPDDKLDAFKLVKLVPLIAGKVAGNTESGIVPEVKLEALRLWFRGALAVASDHLTPVGSLLSAFNT